GRIGGGEAARMADRQRSEALGKTHLIVLGQVLIPQQNDEVVVPAVEDVGEGRVAQRPGQIDAEDFGAERRRQRTRLQLPGPWLTVAYRRLCCGLHRTLLL